MQRDDDLTATTGYPMALLRRALRAVEEHDDPAVRQRAAVKAERWRSVLAGMRDGTIRVGTRTPVADTPAWVTLEVVQGGFATGRYLAEQPLRADEVAVLAAAGAVGGSTDRERLNLWYLTDAGQEVLRAALAEQRFRIDVPEDAALLVVAWLLQHGRWAEALDLVAELRPLLHRLRLTPSFETVPRPAGATVRRATAGEVARRLRGARVPEQLAAMRATLGVWHPLFDRLVALWCDTVDGELPTVAADGSVVGGLPCRRWPDDWPERRERWLADCADALARHATSARQTGPRSHFDRLRRALERCPRDSAALTGRDVAGIRRALAGTITKHGAPGSARRAALRAEQAAAAAAPTHAAVAHVVSARLAGYPADSGFGSLEAVVAAVAEEESAEVPAGTPVPAHLAAKAAHALEAPVDELVERGVVPSGEVLAQVLPQITAGVLAADLGDPALSEVHRQTYAAFRRRRSLLLLDLAAQVRFEELPWVGAVGGLRTRRPDVTAAARRTLDEAVLLALRAFPGTILPNPLVAELMGLARRADLDLPLVQEVAADIFTGRFTDTWRRAALVASTRLAGTLYGRYYDLPPASRWQEAAPVERPRKWRKPRRRPVGDTFSAVCVRRAAEAGAAGGGSWVAANGAVLEQSQVLTTHNLAVLVDGLDRRDTVAELSPELTARALDGVVRALRRPVPSRHAELIALKNAAYAWRQAVFLLSFVPREAQEAAVARLRESARAPGLPPAFGHAVDGLEHAVLGGTFGADGRAPGDAPGRRFLGWSVGPHWLAHAPT